MPAPGRAKTLPNAKCGERSGLALAQPWATSHSLMSLPPTLQ